MSKSWELTIYADGVAILTDHGGRTVWTSDGDDELPEHDFPDCLDYDEDADALVEYLIDAGVLDEDEELEIVEADSTGLHEALADGDDEDEDDEDDEE
jgi:hypothetical protein